MVPVFTYGLPSIIISSIIVEGIIVGIAYVPDVKIAPIQHTEFNESDIDKIMPSDSNTSISSI